MNQLYFKKIEHEIQLRLIALEQAKLLFADVKDYDALCRVQAFLPGNNRSKLIRLPSMSVIAAIESGILHTQRELKEFREKYERT